MPSGMTEREAFNRLPAGPCGICKTTVRRALTIDATIVVLEPQPSPEGEYDIIAWNQNHVWIGDHDPENPSDLRLKEHKHG